MSQPTDAEIDVLYRLTEPGSTIRSVARNAIITECLEVTRMPPSERPTEAELAVLYGLTEPGSTIRKVAHRLGIAETAAKARLHSLYGRLGVLSALQALAKLDGFVYEREPVGKRAPRSAPVNPDFGRFFAGFDATGDGCWEWKGRRYASGYGVVAIAPGYREATHRVSWRAHFGLIPEGMSVCHHCDNPPCVRPDHLFLGTALDNMRDAQRKGRFPHRN
jgi:hypothetical protein